MHSLPTAFGHIFPSNTPPFEVGIRSYNSNSRPCLARNGYVHVCGGSSTFLIFPLRLSSEDTHRFTRNQWQTRSSPQVLFRSHVDTYIGHKTRPQIVVLNMEKHTPSSRLPGDTLYLKYSMHSFLSIALLKSVYGYTHRRAASCKSTSQLQNLNTSQGRVHWIQNTSNFFSNLESTASFGRKYLECSMYLFFIFLIRYLDVKCAWGRPVSTIIVPYE